MREGIVVGLGLGGVVFGRGRQQPLETPLQHLAHHRVVVARRQAFGFDVELAVLVLDEAVRARHDHGADGIGALDVAVVVDLDPLRRMRQPKRGDHRLQQPSLGRGIGELAAERLARIGQRVRDQFLLFAAPRRGDFHLESGLDRERIGQQFGFFDLVRQQDEFRRRFVVVELREERGQHLFRSKRFLRARKIGAVAPVLSGAKEEHLDAGISALLMDGEHVGFLHGARIDALLRLDRRERGEAVAVKRRGFELEFAGGLFHFGRQLLLHQPAAAGQEILGLAHQFGIAGKIDLAGTRPRAAADLIEQARPRAAFKKRVGAGAHQKRALQRRDGAIDRARRSEWPEILAGPRLRAAMLEDLRRPVIAGDQNIGKRLVVAQLHVEAGPQLLDQIGLEQQRLGLGRGRHDLDRHGGGDHAQDAGRLDRAHPRVGGKPVADVFRLADIQHVIGRIEHAIDAGRGWGQPHRLLDRGMADRQRPFRHRLVALFRNFGQPCLVVLFGCDASRDRYLPRPAPAAANPAGNRAAGGGPGASGSSVKS